MSQENKKFKEKLSEKGGNKSEIGRKLSVSSQLLGQYEKGRQKPKEEFFDKWMQVYKEDIRNIFKTNVSNEDEENINTGQDDGPSKTIILNLSESNKEQARANRLQAEANLKQVKNNEELISFIKTTVRDDQQTLRESVAMILGLREYLIELGSHVNKTSKKEVEQLLNSKVKRAKEKAEKKGTHSEEHR